MKQCCALILIFSITNLAHATDVKANYIQWCLGRLGQEDLWNCDRVQKTETDKCMCKDFTKKVVLVCNSSADKSIKDCGRVVKGADQELEACMQKTRLKHFQDQFNSVIIEEVNKRCHLSMKPINTLPGK